MSAPASIAVACPSPTDRASITDWLSQSGYVAFALTDLLGLDQQLQGQPIEALVADMALLPREDTMRDLVRRLGSNRPLVVVGDASRVPATLRGDVSVVPRPLTREALVIGVGLALAEGRPVRRFPRKAVEPIRQDRGHPDKRRRPVARGAVTPREARWLALAAAAASLCLASAAGLRAAGLSAAYLAMSAAYTLTLKHLPVVDVVVIAAGFMLRLLTGTVGIGIEPSQWLIAWGFLLTLFLGFAKRRAEIARLAGAAGQHRAVLDQYSIGFLDRAVALCAAAMVAAYAWYTLAPERARLHDTDRLVLTLPWVLLGTLRYLYRLRSRGGGGDPAEELMRDPVLGAAVAGWLATVLWLIG